MDHTFTITYEFTLPNKAIERFELNFDTTTIELIDTMCNEPPFWAKLSYQQCPHCPLNADSHPYCPVALNLVPAITRFDQLMSFDKIAVIVTSPERQVIQSTSAQEGLSSLMGLLIAGSRCPYTHFFKPMARFHLPFANKDETMWRAAATFLLAAYFSKQGLRTSDFPLDGLISIYNDVARLNDAMIQRLRAATSKDSAVNALVHLDVFAKFLTPPLEDTLMQIKSVFDPFIETCKD
ncbi:MAG: hypothetical protein C4519_26225 [Desulfobacteraceae bacterium]|nr:MAG: hypothetical protein C4519_26225 [Desulfobacteraceae bacterium]